MATVPRRRVSKTATKARPVSRRRDRETEETEETDEEIEDQLEELSDEDEEAKEEPPPRRSKTTRRSTRPKPEDYDADEDEPEEPADDEDEPEEEERPRSRRVGSKSKSIKVGRNQGVRTGWDGAEETRKAGGGGVARLTLSKEPALIKFLEPAPFASFRQHWVTQGGNQGDRPYTCIGVECPLCALGDRTSGSSMFNVLHLSSSGPEVKILQIAVKATEHLKDVSTSKKTGTTDLEKDFFTAVRTGKGNTSQTNFRPLKFRDLEEDWPEIFEHFDPEDMDSVIEEAREDIFDKSIVQTSTKKQLDEVAKFLAED